MNKAILLAAVLGLGALPAVWHVNAADTPAAPAAPATSALAQMETTANAAFDKGEYTKALPLYRKLAEAHKADPKKLGPIEERIRVCQKQLEGKLTDDQAAGEPEVKTSAEERKRHARPKNGEAYALTIKELGNFEYDAEKGGNIPEDVKQLDGAKIRAPGYMIPLDQADNITQFALVPSLFACCLGQAPQVQHTLIVNTPKGKAVSYFPEEIIVEGTLRVNEKKEDGLVISVFEVECNSVKPAPK
jgi:hypothetical protein